MQLTIGFSPCPNDTFMLDALLHGRIETSDLSWISEIQDVETLNKMALDGKLDVTKVSFSTWLRIQNDYVLLPSGAAMGRGCGPLVIALRSRSEVELNAGPIAIPGELTTANLLFSLRYPNAQNKVPMLFSEIEGAIQDGSVVAGVIIHENRFTYQSKGLVKIVDLGEYWESETGAPIPLGAYVAKKSLGSQRIKTIGDTIRASVQHAFDHPMDSRDFVKAHSQELSDDVIEAHISTYVNSFSLDLGEQGNAAITLLQSAAQTVHPS